MRDSQTDFPLDDLPSLLRSAADQIEELTRKPEPFTAPLKLAEIRETVCDVWDISLPQLLSDRRNPQVVHPRFAAWRLARDLTTCSYIMIGGRFQRDHTTIMHGIHRANDLLKESADFKSKYRICESILDAGTGKPVGRVTHAEGGKQSFAADNVVTTVRFPASRPGRVL